MFKTVLLSTAALALIATAADARPQITLSNNNRFVTVTSGKSQGAAKFAPGTAYVYTTLAKNKEGSYFCCFGNTVSGPSSFLGKAYGVAEQFTLSAAATITTLTAAVGYESGDQKVILTLYSDNGNEPGTVLAKGKATSKTLFGSCCGVVNAKISSTSLKANTPYWVAVTTTGANFEAAWFQVSDEVDVPITIAGTSDGGTTWGPSGSLTVETPAIGVR